MDLTVLTAVRPGDKLDIHYVNSLNEDVLLQTNVYDVISETEILIQNPLKDSKIYMLPMDVDITVFAKRQDFGVLAFRLHLVKREKMGNVYTILGQVVSELQKQQRRHFFRVKLYLDLELYFLRDKMGEPLDYYVFDPDAVEEEEVQIKVTLTDISGGGVGIRTRVGLPEGTYVYAKLTFLDKPVEITGIVVRSFESDKYLGEYELGISFEKLSPEAVRVITSYVFKKQQSFRRKERDNG